MAPVEATSLSRLLNKCQLCEPSSFGFKPIYLPVFMCINRNSFAFYSFTISLSKCVLIKWWIVWFVSGFNLTAHNLFAFIRRFSGELSVSLYLLFVNSPILIALEPLITLFPFSIALIEQSFSIRRYYARNWLNSWLDCAPNWFHLNCFMTAPGRIDGVKHGTFKWSRCQRLEATEIDFPYNVLNEGIVRRLTGI